MSDEPEKDQEKRIALWPGRNREKGDNHPYLTGRLTLNGEKFFVTLWKRKRESDRQPVLSGQITIAKDDQLDI